ncbi:MAG: glutaredoxin family protein [Pseudomonadota bacterium]|uniref:glutaredoxin family protein n=1 Tax=Thermithiobacillus tepidarius TaxID=929 RepID=UPI0012DC24E7|nr:thioredoxin family protein [Thermithiobacillus tepidarius]
MNIKLVTTRSCHCNAIEQELRDLGLDYEFLYAEEQPELVARFAIRHCPMLIIDDMHVIPVDGQSEGQLRALLQL